MLSFKNNRFDVKTFGFILLGLTSTHSLGTAKNVTTCGTNTDTQINERTRAQTCGGNRKAHRSMAFKRVV